MPTYRTDAGTAPGAIQEPRLVCEQCGEVVGRVRATVDAAELPPCTVRSFVRHEDISVRLVIALWTEMRKVVRRHEARCGSEAGR